MRKAGLNPSLFYWRLIMKGLHIADLHIDRPFEGLRYVDADLEYLLAQSTQSLLRNIETLAIEEEVDLVLFCGDTFHTPHPHLEILNQWQQHLNRLVQSGIQVAVIQGNHDYMNTDFQYDDDMMWWPSEEVETKYWFTKQHEKIAVSGFSYEGPHIEQDKVSEFPVKDRSVDYHIGLYHGQLTGDYAPFKIEDLKSKDYDYWALGHIHQYEKLAENIYYPGTPQGKSRRDFNKGSVILFTLNGEEQYIEPIDIAPVHYEKLTASAYEQGQFNYDGVELIDLIVSQGDMHDINGLTEEIASSIAPIDMDKFIVDLVPTQPETPQLDTDLMQELKVNYLQEAIYLDLLDSVITPEWQFLLPKLLNRRHQVIDESLVEFMNELNGGRNGDY